MIVLRIPELNAGKAFLVQLEKSKVISLPTTQQQLYTYSSFFFFYFPLYTAPTTSHAFYPCEI